jgi:hypothetical protein
MYTNPRAAGHVVRMKPSGGWRGERPGWDLDLIRLRRQVSCVDRVDPAYRLRVCPFGFPEVVRTPCRCSAAIARAPNAWVRMPPSAPTVKEAECTTGGWRSSMGSRGAQRQVGTASAETATS